MATLSGITTPSLTFDEGSAPSTPAASDVVIYAKTDGLLYSQDDVGTETLVSGGATLANPMTTAGDMIVGGASGVATRALAPKFHGVKANTSATTSVNSDSWTPVAMAAADSYDTDAYHDTATNNTRLTVPAGLGGYYRITGQIVWDTNTTGVRYIGVMKNGTEQDLYLSQPAASGLYQQRAGVVLLLVATDYIELGAYQTSGTARTVGGSTTTWVSMELVGTS